MKIESIRGAFLAKIKTDKRFRIGIIIGAVVVFEAVVACVYIASHMISDRIAEDRQAYADSLKYVGSTSPRLAGLTNSSWDGSINPSVALTEHSYTANLDYGYAEHQLEVNVLPSMYDAGEIIWESDNEQIATVDENGLVRMYSPGCATITARLADGSAVDWCQLYVNQPVNGVLISKSTVNISTDSDSIALSAVFSPDNATDKTVIWSSSNPDVATVDDTGTVTPVSGGTAKITVKTNDGGYTADCFVHVTAQNPSTARVHISKKPSGALLSGSAFSLEAELKGTASPNSVITWASDNESVASVGEDGSLTIGEEGTATITASADGCTSDSFIVTVNNDSGRSYGNVVVAQRSSDYEPNEDIASSSFGGGTLSSRSGGTGGVYYTQYSISLSDFVNRQMNTSPAPKISRNGGTDTATRDEVYQYMNPASFSTGAYKYQFLDLSASNGLTSDILDEFLKGKGVLEGQGKAFIEAANRYNVSEVYLVAHACLETGNGTSTLAKGVSYNGTKVYNMYGIGAVDSNAVGGGSAKAYSEGWTSVEEAIIGGAGWISENYINSSQNKQNTLYKMKWNPDNPCQHQYATSIDWGVYQAVNIKKIFDSFPNAVLTFDVPVFTDTAQIPLN